MYLFGLSQESEKIATDVPVLLVEEGGGQTQVPDTPSSPNPAAMSQRERRERKQMKHSSVFSQHTPCGTNTSCTSLVVLHDKVSR